MYFSGIIYITVTEEEKGDHARASHSWLGKYTQDFFHEGKDPDHESPHTQAQVREGITGARDCISISYGIGEETPGGMLGIEGAKLVDSEEATGVEGETWMILNIKVSCMRYEGSILN